jgi:uncharacterized protein YkwD
MMNPDRHHVLAVHPVRPRRPSARAIGVLAAAVFVTLLVPVARPARADTAVADEALAAVNAYRAMSALPPVALNADWSTQATQHSCYMLRNGLTHGEQPGLPGYTAGGDTAGRNSNVAVHSSPDTGPWDHIDRWMTAPFHAIAILRPGWHTTGYGQCNDSDPATPWGSAATLDVIRGLDLSVSSAAPVVFPGDGATVMLDRFTSEYPDPVEMCGWSGDAGLPLIAMFPGDVSGAGATLTGPAGPVEVCVLQPGSVGGNQFAESALAGAHAVVVVPRAPLAPGAYAAAVSGSGGAVGWSFTVQPPGAAVPAPDTFAVGPPTRFDAVEPFRLGDSRVGQRITRLVAGVVTEVAVADPDVVAVSANFVAVTPSGAGYLTLYDCRAERPLVSSVAYAPFDVVANEAIVPLQDGKLCVYSKAATDVIIDVNGFFRQDATAGFVPTTPTRIYDSRDSGRLAAGEIRAVAVPQAAAPHAAQAVVLSVVAIGPSAGGHLRVYPCGSTTGSEISSLNYEAGDVLPNVVVTPTDGQGRVCVQSLSDTDVAIDATGYFADGDGLAFQALAPIRMLDTRALDPALNPLTAGIRVAAGATVRLPIAGVRGVPSDAAAASVNITLTDPTGAGHVTAFPCGARPDTSSVNIAPGVTAAASATMVKLSGDGDLCLYSRAAVHVIVDINGVWR